MPQTPNKLNRLWLELKRRKVFGVVTTYSATAYIIIEVINNLAVPLHLPEWVATLILIILLIGLPVVIILSWVFDFTPKGIKKTESLEEIESKEIVFKPVKRKLRASYVLNALLIIAVLVLAYPRIFKRNSLERLRSAGARISIAVLPFQNMTNDTIWDIWQDGIQENLISFLSNFPEDLKVRQTASITTLIQSNRLTNYASITPSIATAISQKLDADVFIQGSINQAGSTVRVNAQLNDSKTGNVLKSFQINGTFENILPTVDSLSILVKNFLIISELVKAEPPNVVKYVATTKNPEAFKYVIRGNNEFYAIRDYSTAIDMYLRAITIDSNYIWPKIMISYAYLNLDLYDNGKKWLEKVYENRQQLPMIYETWVNVLHAIYFETPYETIKYSKKLLEIDDQLPDVIGDMGYVYNILEEYPQAIQESEKGLEIYKKWGVKPSWVYEYTNLGLAYHKTGQYKKEKQLYKKAEKDFPDDPALIQRKAILMLAEGDTNTANIYIEEYKSVSNYNSSPEVNIAKGLADIYTEANILGKAEEYYRQALLLEPNNPVRMNTLAYFIIDKDRDINEGIDLVSKALELNPDNFNYLHTMGWGLHKQGKHLEALDILQRSWDLRREKAIYDHTAFLHLEAIKKAVANQ